MAEFLAGDVLVRLRAETTGFERSLDQATQKLHTVEQATQQTARQLSQLPFNAIQNAIDSFSRSIQQAGNNQDRYRAAIRQAEDTLKQFNVTANASGEIVDRFGQRLSQASAEALRGFQAGVREARAELNQLQQFGINAAAGGAGGGGLLQSVLGVAGGIGLATGLTALVHQVKEFVTASVALSAKMQDLNLSFRAIDGSAAAANKTLTFLFETSNRLGVNFETVADGFKRLDQAAKGSSLEGAGIRAVLDNVLAGTKALGTSQQQIGQLFLTLEQIMTKGRLSAEEYRRQLGNAVPGGLKLLADGLGVTTQALDQMAQSGLIPAEAAVVALAISMGKLGQNPQETVERLSTTFAQLKNETTAWMTAIGDGIASSLKPFLDTLVSISKELREIFNIRPPGTTAPVPERQSVVPSPYTDLITQQAKAQGVDPGLLSRLIQAESNFNPTARSPAGASGLGQLMLPTAQGLEMGVTAENLQEPERNIRLAAKYLGEMLEQFRGFPDQVKLALAAYNAGPGSVMAAIKATRLTEGDVTFERVLARLPKPQETGPYVERVLAPRTETPAAAPTGTAAAPVTTSGTPATSAATAGLDVTKTLQATIDKTLEGIPRLEKEMDALAQSSLNWGGVLGTQVRKEADELVKKFVQTAELLARFPDLLAKMTPEQRAQLDIMAKQVAVFQQRIEDETQTEGNARKRIQEFRAADAAEAAMMAEDAQNAAKTLQLLRENEQEVEKNRTALEALARSYGMTKQERDVDTASILANSLAGTAWQTQAQEQLKLIQEISRVEAQLPELRRQAAASARTFEESQVGTRFTTDLEGQLEQLRVPREERLSARLRRQAQRKGTEITPEQEALLRQIEAQQQWNEVIATTERIGDAAAQTLTQGLQSIVDGTKTVSQAFAAMAQSILKSIAEITLNEGFKSLIRLGLGLLTTALAPGASAGAGIGDTTAVAAGSGVGEIGIGTTLGRGFTFQHGGVVEKPTRAIIGENPGNNPEFVLNSRQMRQAMTSAIQAAPSAGGQAAGGSTDVAVILVDNRGDAERKAAQQRGLGRTVIIQEVVRDLSQGSGSTIGRAMRAGGH